MEENFKESDGRISDQNYKNFRRERGYTFLKEDQSSYYYADNGGDIHIIPKDKLIGISKLQRFTNWAARRGWLQEDLCSYLGNTIKRISGSEDVMIEMTELVHGCERFRGSNSHQGNLTTVYKSGIFKEKKPKIIINE